MRWREIETIPCPVAQALAVIGDTWTILILRDALRGATKFDEFLRSTGASRATLSERLAHLVDHGVFRRVQYENHPPRHAYHLTPRGRALQPVLMMMAHWSEEHLGKTANGKPLRMAGRRHTICDHNFSPVVTCSHCGEPAPPETVAYDAPRQELPLPSAVESR